MVVTTKSGAGPVKSRDTMIALPDAERGNGVTCFELSDEFLQYEGGPRERSIKRGGKTGARARCKQRPAVGRIPAKGFS